LSDINVKISTGGLKEGYTVLGGKVKL